MRTSVENQTRIFQGKGLPWVDIRAIEQANPGRPCLFEVVKGDGWHRFRYGFLVAGPATSAAAMTGLIRAYRESYPGAKLYLSHGR